MHAEVSAEFAEHSIRAALSAIDAIGVAIVEHVMQSRQRLPQKVLPLFAGRLAEAPAESSIGTAFLKAFNAAIVPLSWGRVEADEGRQNWAACDSEIQWCTSQGLRIGGGPLLELSRRALPDWIYLWENDFDNLMMVAGDYVRAAVNRYRGKVHFWNAAGRIITGDALGLEEEQQVRLAVRAVEVIRSVDTQTPVIVSFDQPWAEYMARRESDLAPLQFADALVRSDLGISGIGLEINFGTSPAATLPRDLLGVQQPVGSLDHTWVAALGFACRAGRKIRIHTGRAATLVGNLPADSRSAADRAGRDLEPAARSGSGRFSADGLGRSQRSGEAELRDACRAAEAIFGLGAFATEIPQAVLAASD